MVLPETLRRFPLLAELEPEFLAQLSSLSQDKAVEKEEWLFHEGDNADALYFIVRGSVELKLKLDEKRNIYVTLTTLGEGDALGWSAIVEPYVYTLGAVASDHTMLLSLDGEKLRVLLEKEPEQGYVLMRSIAQAMATRVNVLSERAPSLSWRFVVSTLLFVVGVGGGALALLLIASTIIAAITGISNALQGLPVALFCLLFPAMFLILARMTYPGEPQNTPQG